MQYTPWSPQSFAQFSIGIIHQGGADKAPIALSTLPLISLARYVKSTNLSKICNKYSSYSLNIYLTISYHITKLEYSIIF